MSGKYYLTKEAANDIEEFREYLQNRGGESIADHFIGWIFSKFDILSDYPKIGRKRNDLHPGLLHFPEKRYRQNIFYRKTPQGIEITRVLSVFKDYYEILKEK